MRMISQLVYGYVASVAQVMTSLPALDLVALNPLLTTNPTLTKKPGDDISSKN